MARRTVRIEVEECPQPMVWMFARGWKYRQPLHTEYTLTPRESPAYPAALEAAIERCLIWAKANGYTKITQP